MAKIMEFKNNRQEYAFHVAFYQGSENRVPVIVLKNLVTGAIVECPGFEPYYLRLNERTFEDQTLKGKAYRITAFLNYLLHNTNVGSLSDVTTDMLRGFLMAYKNKMDKKRAPGSWQREVEDIYDFLCRFIEDSGVACKIAPEELVKYTVAYDEKGRRVVKKELNYLGVKPPRGNTRKNRLFVESYLPLLIYDARKWDPMLVLGIASGAYGGLREGEVVNMTRGSVKEELGGFGRLKGVTVDLNEPAPFAVSYAGKTGFGKIKKYRTQKIYDDFTSDFQKIYVEHKKMLDARGLPAGKDDPLFFDQYGRAMTVSTYTGRLKKLFYDHFLPNLKLLCQHENIWAENAGYIEAYEKEYPGAHMLRHWFTMYLVTHANLTPEEIAKWRGDESVDSFKDYLHLNRDLINAFHNAAFRFQESILEELL